MKRVFAVCAAVAAVAVGSAADWPRFRGPNGTGVADGSAPVKFDLKTDTAWKTEIPGSGWGSPVVVKGKVFLQTAGDDGTKRHLVCVDGTTGKVAWKADVDSGAAPGMHKKNSAASGTPCSDGERVFAAFWVGGAIGIYAYDFDGKQQWGTLLGTYTGQHGAAHSPMTFDGKVYFNLDQDGAAELIALDAKTGKVSWRKPRKANRSSYTTPLVLEEKGKPAQLILGSTTTVDSYDPKTGDVNWSFTIKWPNPNKQLRAVGQQVIAGGYVITYCGEGGAGRYAVAVKTDGTGDVSATAKVWETGNREKTPYVPSMIAHEGHLYWISDSGLASCADAKTGKIAWSEKVFERAISASPVLIGETLLAIDEAGNVASFKVSPKGLGDVEKSALGEQVYASPAVADGKLFIRGAKHLYCFGGKGS